MKERILTHWTFTRMLYLIIGIAVIVQSVIIHQWIGIAFGGYFASMGLFAYGCAAGNCFGGNIKTTSNPKEIELTSEVEFEELKKK